jgi:hypothetical protein
MSGPMALNFGVRPLKSVTGLFACVNFHEDVVRVAQAHALVHDGLGDAAQRAPNEGVSLRVRRNRVLNL